MFDWFAVRDETKKVDPAGLNVYVEPNQNGN